VNVSLQNPFNVEEASVCMCAYVFMVDEGRKSVSFNLDDHD